METLKLNHWDFLKNLPTILFGYIVMLPQRSAPDHRYDLMVQHLEELLCDVVFAVAVLKGQIEPVPLPQLIFRAAGD